MARIAVINNDTDFLTLMNELLEARGHDTIVSRESSSAFPMIKAEKPDLVVLDVRMEQPESGWLVLDLIELDPETTHIPVVVCSAAVQELRDKEEWLRQHGIATLMKPFDIDDLYSTVDAALGAKPD